MEKKNFSGQVCWLHLGRHYALRKEVCGTPELVRCRIAVFVLIYHEFRIYAASIENSKICMSFYPYLKIILFFMARVFVRLELKIQKFACRCILTIL